MFNVLNLVIVFQERNLVHRKLESRYNEDMSLCLVAGPILENDSHLLRHLSFLHLSITLVIQSNDNQDALFYF